MPPPTLKHTLHSDLRAARKTQRLTQADLAAKTGLSIPAIRRLELGCGNLSSLLKTAEALGLLWRGGSLPAADTVGQRVATLRKRQKISQVDFAEMLGVSQPTLVLLERHNRGRMDTLQQALVRLGAGARLVAESERATFFTAAGNSSTYHGWTTPKWLLGVLCSAFGRFDLDPCSPGGGEYAKVHFTESHDGLKLPWCGTTFMNPPYSKMIGKWLAKARGEAESGRAAVVVGLVPARTDTRWWRQGVTEASCVAVIFLSGRLRFGDGEQSAPFPSAIVIWGGTPEQIDALMSVLPNAWCPQVRGRGPAPRLHQGSQPVRSRIGG